MYEKEADELGVVDPELMKKATELVEKRGYKVYDYNPFGNDLGSGALKTRRGVRKKMYFGLFGKDTDEAKKFIDDGSYIDSNGQIFFTKWKKKTSRRIIT